MTGSRLQKILLFAGFCQVINAHLIYRNTFFKSGNQFGQLWPTSMQRLILKNCGLDSFPNLEGLSEKQLIELNLSRNRIPSVPLMLTNLGSVTSLNLSENLLTALPAQISQLGQLKELNLERNLLSSLPTQISELTNLEILTLPFNLLTEFPKELYKLENLQLLLLDSNKIKSISDEISQMTSLRFLSMVELPDIEIPPAIVHCKNLKELVHTPSQTFVVPANISEYGNEIVVRYFYLLRSLKVTNLQFKSHWKPDILFKSCKVCGAAFNYVNRRVSSLFCFGSDQPSKLIMFYL
jgi:Leucine-rich repeat (LRR) protein